MSVCTEKGDLRERRMREEGRLDERRGSVGDDLRKKKKCSVYVKGIVRRTF